VSLPVGDLVEGWWPPAPRTAGAAVGGLLIWGIASGVDSFDATNNFAQNGWGDFSPGGYGLGSTILVEIIFTAILVFVVLFVFSMQGTIGPLVWLLLIS